MRISSLAFSLSLYSCYFSSVPVPSPAIKFHSFKTQKLGASKCCGCSQKREGKSQPTKKPTHEEGKLTLCKFSNQNAEQAEQGRAPLSGGLCGGGSTLCRQTPRRKGHLAPCSEPGTLSRRPHNTCSPTF